MKQTTISLLFIVISYLLNAQQAEVVQRLMNQQAQAATVTLMPDVLKNEGAEVLPQVQGFKGCELKLKHQYKSLLGIHYYYEQLYKNKPIYGCNLMVSMNHQGELLSSFHTLVNTDEFDEPNASVQHIQYWLIQGKKLLPAITENQSHHFTLKHPDGTLLYTKDQRLYYTDTVVKAMVFNPDPLTTAQVTYGKGGAYRNFNDSDYALLNDQRVLKSFPATFNNDTFYLANKYCKITDVEAPFYVPSTSLTGEFLFTRRQYGFKEVMAMYHIYATQLYIQSLGFTNQVNYQLKVDPHASLADQSYFSYSEGDTVLRFGLGGVPDAEDADVIVHEYTHAISFSLNPLGVESNDRKAIEEGLCDAMACAYSKKLSNYKWKNIFSWDGHNEFWAGRNGASTKTYDDRIESYYSDSEIWSSAMNSLSETIGEDALIKLILAVIPQFTPHTTMPQAAKLMYDADSILNNKLNQGYLALEFNARKLGVFPVGLNDVTFNKKVSIVNTLSFAQGIGDASVLLKEHGDFTVTVFGANGQKVNTYNGREIMLKTNEYKAGIYFLTINYNNRNEYYKLIKY